MIKATIHTFLTCRAVAFTLAKSQDISLGRLTRTLQRFNESRAGLGRLGLEADILPLAMQFLEILWSPLTYE